MNSEIERDVLARKWTHDFDEVAGRASPPDRMDAILRRAAREADAPHASSTQRATRLWPAALVLLSVGVTVGVSVLRSESPTAMPGSPSVASMQDKKTEQEKKRAAEEAAKKKQREAQKAADAAKAATDIANQRAVEPQKKNLEKIAGALAEARRAAAIRASKDKLLRKRELQAKTDELEKQIEETAAELQAVGQLRKLAEQDKKKRQGQAKDKGTAKFGPAEEKQKKKDEAARQRALAQRIAMLREAEAALAAQLRANGRIRTGLRVSKPKNPLIQGDYRDALDRLTRSRSKLNTTTDPAAARKIIDEMTRILADARRALWESEQAAGKKKN